MAKILLGINTLTEVSQPVYANHMQYFFNLGRRTEHDVCLYTPNRMGIDKMRNTCGKLAMDNGFDYVLFLDDDVIVPIDSLERMVSADKDVVAGHTLIRGYPFKNMFFKNDKEAGTLVNYQDYEEHLPDDQLLPVDAVGFSYCLIKTSLIKLVPPPYFITGAYNTEDIYFCVKARHHVPNCSIFVHIGIPTMHKVGYEFIGPGNLEAYKTYCEEVYPFMKTDEPKEGDLGTDGVKTTTIQAADKRDSNAGDESNVCGIEEIIFNDVWGKGTGIVPIEVNLKEELKLNANPN